MSLSYSTGKLSKGGFLFFNFFLALSVIVCMFAGVKTMKYMKAFTITETEKPNTTSVWRCNKDGKPFANGFVKRFTGKDASAKAIELMDFLQWAFDLGKQSV